MANAIRLGTRGIERRGALTREPVDIPAEILMPGAEPIECRIVDLSDTGARLSLESILGVHRPQHADAS